MDTQERSKLAIDMEEMMELYDQLATPGIPHKQLAQLSGSWLTKTTTWIESDKPPMEGSGTCEQKMLLGGRFLQQEYEGEMLGSAFSGINVIGYNNHAGKYVSIWIDSMSTGIYYFEGTAGEDGKTITQESTYDDPVRGLTTWRSVMTIVENDRLEYEMYLISQEGKEEKMMQMTLARRQ